MLKSCQSNHSDEGKLHVMASGSQGSSKKDAVFRSSAAANCSSFMSSSNRPLKQDSSKTRVSASVTSQELCERKLTVGIIDKRSTKAWCKISSKNILEYTVHLETSANWRRSTIFKYPDYIALIRKLKTTTTTIHNDLFFLNANLIYYVTETILPLEYSNLVLLEKPNMILKTLVKHCTHKYWRRINHSSNLN